MKCNNAVLLLVSATVIAVFSDQAFGMPPAQCSPGLLDEVPPRIRKVCAALSTLYELGTAMENYIDDKGKFMHQLSRFFKVRNVPKIISYVGILHICMCIHTYLI